MIILTYNLSTFNFVHVLVIGGKLFFGTYTTFLPSITFMCMSRLESKWELSAIEKKMQIEPFHFHP